MEHEGVEHGTQFRGLNCGELKNDEVLTDFTRYLRADPAINCDGGVHQVGRFPRVCLGYHGSCCARGSGASGGRGRGLFTTFQSPPTPPHARTTRASSART